jgi:ubiquinone/menaquinone biosynthesis C-methylase UbiE
MSGKGWSSNEFADAWKRRGEERRRNMAVVTERMFDAARIGPGARVLDLGTGTGDTALLAAEKVAPGGSVLATDASEAMVQAAREAVAAAGLGDGKTVTVMVRRMDASSPDAEEGAFDAVIGRQVLMFVDRPRALPSLLRLLRAGGRLAATVWGPIADNPYHGITIEVARAHGGWGEPLPEMVRAFSVNDPDEWRRALEGAGFRDVTVEPVRGQRPFDSAEKAFASMQESPIHREPVERLPPAARQEAWKEIEAACRPYGGVFPTVHLVLSGERPGRG